MKFVCKDYLFTNICHIPQDEIGPHAQALPKHHEQGLKENCNNPLKYVLDLDLYKGVLKVSHFSIDTLSLSGNL